MLDEINILLVEDNDLDAEILKRALRKIGASGTLLRAEDGLEALDILKKDAEAHVLPRPLVILLDINMPRMNGHEFLENLRKTEEIKDAHVIVLTTSDSKTDVDRAYQNNASGYIVKPSSSSDLQHILETLHRFWAICQHPNNRF